MRFIKKITKYSDARLISMIFLLWFGGLLIIPQFYFCYFGIRECWQLGPLGNWDGEHFLRIINRGYINDFSFAFFPLFPALVSFLSYLLPAPSLIIGLLVNFISTWIGMVYLGKLLRLNFKRNQMLWTILLLLSFPLSFFLIIFYSEGLFFLLSVLSIYFYRQKKSTATIFCLTLLSLTRMAGVALLAAILLDVWRHKELRNLFLLPFLGIGSFIFAAFIKTGNVFAIVQAETNWERLVVFPGFALYNSIWVLLREGISYQNYSIFLDLLLVITVILLLVRSFKKIPRLYWNYSLFSLLIPLSTSTFLSFPRFLVVIFPLFLAFYQSSNTMVRTIYLVCGLFFLQILFILFLQGGWVA